LKEIKMLRNDLAKISRTTGVDIEKNGGLIFKPTIRGAFVTARIKNQLLAVAKDPAITALVGENDRLAHFALNLFESSGIAIPRQLSIAGFDNSIESLGVGLTSYDFNTPAYVNAITDFLLRPPQPRGKTPHRGTIEVEGRVIMRRSTAATG
jgi:DNA-binding LacI/PurR family transcriptional regulator